MLTQLVIPSPQCSHEYEVVKGFNVSNMSHWVQLYGGNTFPLIVKVLDEAKTWVQQSGRLDKKAGRENIQTLELSSTQNNVLDLAKWYKFVTACVGLLAGGYSNCEYSQTFHSCNRKTFDLLMLSILVFLNQTQGVFLLKSQKFENATSEEDFREAMERGPHSFG